MADVAQVAGWHRTRISQLRDSMPPADGIGSTEARPRWSGSTIAEFLAKEGRRPDPEVASWLVQGPDGPKLSKRDTAVITLQRTGPTPFYDAPPLQVHVATYVDYNTYRRVWLATVLAPSDPWQIFGVGRGWGEHSETTLAHLVRQLQEQVEGQPRIKGFRHLIGTLVVLSTDCTPGAVTAGGRWRDGTTRIVDVFEDWDEAELDNRADVDPTTADLYPHLAAALGHRLPYWPYACNTPDLVGAWDPKLERGVPCTIPPPAADAYLFLQMCEGTARTINGEELAESLVELGREYWDLMAMPYTGLDSRDETSLPDWADPEVWQMAVDIQLPEVPEPSRRADIFTALRWTQTAENLPPRLAEAARRYFGDPDSAGVVVVDLTTLPAHVAEVLEKADRRSDPPGRTSLQARAIATALDSYPQVTVDTWPTPGHPAWRGRIEGQPLVAVHVPRLMSVHAGNGEPVELVVVKPVQVDGAGAVGFVVTATGVVMMLPDHGSAERLAAAVEHVAAKPGEPTPIPGIPGPYSETLVTALQGALAAGTATIPWRRVLGMVRQFTTPDHLKEDRAEPTNL